MDEKLMFISNDYKQNYLFSLDTDGKTNQSNKIKLPKVLNTTPSPLWGAQILIVHIQ